MTTSLKSADDRVRQLEAKHDLLRYEVDGWCVWPLLRFRVSQAMANLPLAKRDELPRNERIAFAAKDLTGLMYARKACYVVKTYSSARAEQKGSLYEDVFFDALLPHIGSYFKIEGLNSKVFIPRSRNALIKSDITSTALEIMASVLSRVGIPGYISRIASSLSLHFKQELDIEIFTTQEIEKSLRYFYWCKKLYAWLFDRIRPKYLLLADAGEFVIIAAAKEKGIKVFEFQHGSTYRYHSGYSWTSYALDYKGKMPIPDRILLYGEHWKKEMEANGFWREELCPVGSIRLDQYRNISAIHKTTDRALCTIVLTTQGIDTQKLIAFIADFLTITRRQLKFRLYIKLHPVYETDKKPYEDVFQTNKNVHVILGTESPSTFELLCGADLHASISSTCHYEALGLGIPTIILPFTSHEIVLPLKKAGHAFLVQTPKDLFDIMRGRHYEVPREIGSFYFKPGALQKIKRALEV